MVSRKAPRCSGTRIWSMIIGLLQTIFGALSLTVAIIIAISPPDFPYMEYLKFEHDVSIAEATKGKIVLMHILIITMISNTLVLIGGILVIIGVIKNSEVLLQVSIVIEKLWLLLVVLELMLGKYGSNPLTFGLKVVNIIIIALCIALLHAHCKQIVDFEARHSNQNQNQNGSGNIMYGTSSRNGNSNTNGYRNGNDNDNNRFYTERFNADEKY